MKSDLASLEIRILSRNPLEQYSTEHSQREGWIAVYKRNPNRPASGGWASERKAPEARKVPMTVNGRRIAVIDAEARTIDALVVGNYMPANGDTLAIACPNSYAVKWNLVSGELSVEQAKKPHEISLSGKKVVGITKGEMTSLIYLAANQSLQSEPQSQERGVLPPLYW